MHTLFAIEDLYGPKIDTLDCEICIRVNRQNGPMYSKMTGLLKPWEEMARNTATVRLTVKNMTTGDTDTRNPRRSVMKTCSDRKKKMNKQKKNYQIETSDNSLFSSNSEIVAKTLP